nr:MAG TPA: hypothetical protein [Caudoviricetes sp.]
MFSNHKRYIVLSYVCTFVYSIDVLLCVYMCLDMGFACVLGFGLSLMY